MNQLLIALRVEHNKAAPRSCSVVEGWAAVARLPIVDMSSFSFFWQQISRVNQQRLCWLQPTSALRSATIVLRGYASLLWIRKALWPKFSWQISSCSISIYSIWSFPIKILVVFLWLFFKTDSKYIFAGLVDKVHRNGSCALNTYLCTPNFL